MNCPFCKRPVTERVKGLTWQIEHECDCAILEFISEYNLDYTIDYTENIQILQSYEIKKWKQQLGG